MGPRESVGFSLWGPSLHKKHYLIDLCIVDRMPVIHARRALYFVEGHDLRVADGLRHTTNGLADISLSHQRGIHRIQTDISNNQANDGWIDLNSEPTLFL